MPVVPQVVLEQVSRRGGEAAVSVLGGTPITYRDLDRASSRMAHVLLRRKVAHGDRVGLCFANPDVDAYAVAYLAVQKAGAAIVPLNPRYTEPELRHVLDHSGARYAIAGGVDLATLERVAGERLLRYPALCEEAQAAPGEPPDVALVESDAAEIVYTSGTTGLPKGVLAPHGNVVGVLNPMLEEMYGGKRYLHPLPIHTFAGTAQLVYCLKYGLHYTVMPKFEPHTFVNALERAGVSCCYAVPSMWLRVLKEVADLDRRRFPGLVYLSFGSAAMPSWAVTRLGEVFPDSMIFNVYGLTEAGNAACMLMPGDHLRKPDSVGRPFGGCEVRIVGERGEALPSGRPGEVQLRLPGVTMRRYFKDGDATARVFDRDGWIHTGDVGTLDADGYLFIVDRLKDVIIQGGNNVSSPEVESTLHEHPDVAAAAVVGLPDDALGEIVAGFVVRKPGSTLTEAALRQHLSERLAPFKLPKKIVFVPELPRNAMGKVLKRELRQMAPALFAGAEVRPC